MKPPSVSFSATSSVYSRIGYETVLNKGQHISGKCASSVEAGAHVLALGAQVGPQDTSHA